MVEERFYLSPQEEEIIREERAAYRALVRKKRRRKRLIKARLKLLGLILFIVLLIWGLIFLITKLVAYINGGNEATEESIDPAFGNIEKTIEFEVQEPEPGPESVEQESVYYHATDDGNVKPIGGEVVGEYVILVDKLKEEVMAGRGYKTIISPASMTKVLTLLVAVENIEEEQLDDTFTFDFEVTNYAFVHDCSVAGFKENETVTVRDLLYGTILPSGGEAALGLAVYIAGSQEAFVDMMNKKLDDMGLSGTAHFTNCIGLYDEHHYCTPYDMAMIMCDTMENELCREILSARKYVTSPTTEHPEGIELSNWFLRRIEDKECGLVVYAGKTGFVNESGSCAVSLAYDAADGHEYVCVVANSRSSWRCIYDHVAVYNQFFNPSYVPPSEEEVEEQIEEDQEEEELLRS